MIARDEGFHLADLLSLWMRKPLVVPFETRSLTALMAHLTGVEIPARFIPEPLFEIAEQHVCEQLPWLGALKAPEAARRSWAGFWAWADVLQRRHGDESNGWGTAFRLEPMGPDKITVVSAEEFDELVDGDYPEE